MAFLLHTTLPFPPSLPPIASSPRRRLSINSGGPRSNRGPLVKGRILSIEAIHAIQSLKRIHRTSPTTLDHHITTLLRRLLKSDLISAFKELLRQNHPSLAYKLFSLIIKPEFKPDLTLYADLVNGLNSQGLTEQIDLVIREMEGIDLNDKGLVKLVKGLVEAERREAVVRVYGLMRKCGWGEGEGVEVDEYVGEVLSKGLKRLGEEALADEVDEDVKRLFRGNLRKAVV